MLKRTQKSRKMRSVLAFSLVFSLGGCASLPVSGPVIISELKHNSESKLGLHATGPVKGANPEEIVRGFLRANSSGFTNNFLVARQFLTSEAAANWKPQTKVNIYSSSDYPALEQNGDNRMILKTQLSGALNTYGSYTPANGTMTYADSFELAKQKDGQWRISKLDDGILIPQSVFDTLFTPRPLYFFTPDKSALVADVRWFPAETLYTSTVRALLAGPVNWLAPAVYSAIPPNTVLGTNGVVVSGGTLTVNLDGSLIPAQVSDRNLLYEQINSTLVSRNSQVQQTDIYFTNTQLQPTSALKRLSSYPYTEGKMVAIKGRDLVYFENEKPVKTLLSGSLSGPALSYGNNLRYSVWNGDELGASAANHLDMLSYAYGISKSAYVRPRWDRYGYLWTGAKNNTGSFELFLEANPKVKCDVLADSQLVDFAISRSGAQAIVVRKANENYEILRLAVVRDLTGRPLQLTNAQALADNFQKVLSVAWISESKVAILAIKDAGDKVISVQQIGGNSTEFPAPAKAETMTAGVGEDSIIVGTSDNKLMHRAAGAWHEMASGYQDPANAG